MAGVKYCWHLGQYRPGASGDLEFCTMTLSLKELVILRDLVQIALGELTEPWREAEAIQRKLKRKIGNEVKHNDT